VEVAVGYINRPVDFHIDVGIFESVIGLYDGTGIQSIRYQSIKMKMNSTLLPVAYMSGLEQDKVL
jgi:hypothetical protein